MAVDSTKIACGLLMLLCVLPTSQALGLTRDGRESSSSLGTVDISIRVRNKPAILEPGKKKGKGRRYKRGKPKWIGQEIQSNGQTNFSLCLANAGASVGLIFEKGKDKLTVTTSSGARLELLVKIKAGKKDKGSYARRVCREHAAVLLALADPKKLRKKEGLRGKVKMMVKPE